MPRPVTQEIARRREGNRAGQHGATAAGARSADR
jgi:hypothetical protein